jgi:hypothetical protein
MRPPESGNTASRRHSGREESPQRDLPVQEHVDRPPPEEHGKNEREQEDETATADGRTLSKSHTSNEM